MGKSGAARGNKRRFGSGRGAPRPTPRRGPPAIFVTCEGGRERKCQREALDLIHHYYYSSRPSTAIPKDEAEDGGNPPSESSSAKTDPPGEERPLSLEEELAMLRRGAEAEEVLNYEPNSKRPRTDASAKEAASSMKSPFSIYDAGVRGVVCIVCTLPGCEMVPYDSILAEIKAKREEKGGEEDATKDEARSAEAKTSDDKKKYVLGDEGHERQESDTPDCAGPPLWDAVETVRCIMRDAKRVSDETDDGSTNNDGKKDGGQGGGGQKDAVSPKEQSASPHPGSRFIIRILPMQATCYASVEEIKAVSRSLLKRRLPEFRSDPRRKDGELTFKVEVKRRLCSHLTSGQVIEAITPTVLGGLGGVKFKVNLSDPDFSIRVETCRSLCGISVLPRDAWHENFNLAELANPSSGRGDR